MLRDEASMAGTGRTADDHAESVYSWWLHVQRRLRVRLGEAVFASWFNGLELAHVEGDTAFLTVPTRFLRSWIQEQYSDLIATEVARERPEVRRITISLRQAVLQRVHPKALPAAAGIASVQPVEAAPATSGANASSTSGLPARSPQPQTLNHRQNFANFVVDDGNSLAQAAAMRVAVGAEPLANCNPLFIHAGVGMGKTHLLQAIANEATRLCRRARYVTADAFMYGFASSMRAKNALSFKDRMRGYDLLLTDDIQYLQGGSLQNEFCHTLNALLEEGRTVVVAADRPPGELESVDERIRSRLKGGLVVDIQPHDEETRRRILQLRIAAAQQLHPAFDVDPGIVDFVARTVTTNGRDLDGAVNRLVALANHTGTKISLDKVESTIRDLVAQREPRRPRIEDIQKAVANHFSVSRSDLTSARRTSNVVRPRQIAMYLAKTLTPRSLPEIGRRFGGRDHTTVLHAVRKVASLIDQDRGTRDTIELLRRVLTE